MLRAVDGGIQAIYGGGNIDLAFNSGLGDPE